MYRHLNVTGSPDLIDLNLYKFTTDPKKGATIFEFYIGDRWVPLTKKTGEFLAPKTLRDRFGGVNTMKKFLVIYRTPSALERSLSTASKLTAELPTDLKTESIPLEELSLRTDKVLQSIQGELLNDTSKLTEIDKHIKRDTGIPRSWKK